MSTLFCIHSTNASSPQRTRDSEDEQQSAASEQATIHAMMNGLVKKVEQLEQEIGTGNQSSDNQSREKSYVTKIKQALRPPGHGKEALVGDLPNEQEEVFRLLGNRDNLLTVSGAEPSSGIILAGLPGTGKSFFAEAVAGYLNNLEGHPKCLFYNQSAAQINAGFAGEGAGYVSALFNHIRAQVKDGKKHAILFIDEIDSVAKKRDDLGGGSAGVDMQNTLNQLLTEIADHKNNKGITIIVATNRLSDLDLAFKRTGRMNITLVFSLPNKKQIEYKIKQLSQKYFMWENSTDLLSIDTMIEHEFTYLDIEEVFKQGSYIAFLQWEDNHPEWKSKSVQWQKEHLPAKGEITIKELHYKEAMRRVLDKKEEDKKLSYDETCRKKMKLIGTLHQIKTALPHYDNRDIAKLVMGMGYDGDLKKEFPENF